MRLMEIRRVGGGGGRPAMLVPIVPAGGEGVAHR